MIEFWDFVFVKVLKKVKFCYEGFLAKISLAEFVVLASWRVFNQKVDIIFEGLNAIFYQRKVKHARIKIAVKLINCMSRRMASV